MTIELDRNALASALEVSPGTIAAATITMTTPFQIRRRGVEARIIAGEPESVPDKILIRRLAEAHRCVGRLRTGVALSSLARDAGHSGSYLRTRLPLAFLSPRIQAAILEGAQSPPFWIGPSRRASPHTITGIILPFKSSPDRRGLFTFL